MTLRLRVARGGFSMATAATAAASVVNTPVAIPVLAGLDSRGGGGGFVGKSVGTARCGRHIGGRSSAWPISAVWSGTV